jgi:YggT family protein
MFGDVASFLLDTLFSLFGAVLLLRAWMLAVRLPPFNPVSHGVYQLSNWLVLPLRKVIPNVRNVDWTSIVAAYLIAVLYLVLVVAAAGGSPLGLFPQGLLIALLTVCKWGLSLLLWTTLLLAVLSWVNPRSPAMQVAMQLTAPFLNPIRRAIPTIGGMDMSPLVLFLIIQVLLIVLAKLTFSATMFSL